MDTSPSLTLTVGFILKMSSKEGKSLEEEEIFVCFLLLFGLRQHH